MILPINTLTLEDIEVFFKEYTEIIYVTSTWGATTSKDSLQNNRHFMILTQFIQYCFLNKLACEMQENVQMDTFMHEHLILWLFE